MVFLGIHRTLDDVQAVGGNYHVVALPSHHLIIEFLGLVVHLLAIEVFGLLEGYVALALIVAHADGEAVGGVVVVGVEHHYLLVIGSGLLVVEQFERAVGHGAAVYDGVECTKVLVVLGGIHIRTLAGFEQQVFGLFVVGLLDFFLGLVAVLHIAALAHGGIGVGEIERTQLFGVQFEGDGHDVVAG